MVIINYGIQSKFLCLDLLEKLVKSAKENINETDAKLPSGNTARRRHTSPADTERNKEPDYTPDQLECVKSIKKYVRVKKKH